MELDRDICYRALSTRDPRFDGRFYTCVLTTGIYCRPICPVPPPKPEHCLFLVSAAAAQAAGFRPCLRCRPEVAPGLAGWRGTANTVSRALALIAEGALDGSTPGGDNVERLADRLGVGTRHLRRLFARHLGAAPIAVARAQRLLFAKQLITETALPLADVALAAGFGSIRRFNAVMRETYGRAPGQLRRAPPPAGSFEAAGITLKLPYTTPYDQRSMMAFLGRRAIPGVEAVRGGRYHRTVAVDCDQEGDQGVAQGTIEVTPADGQLLATIRISQVTALANVVGRLRRLFDLDAEITAIESHLARDPRLAPAIAAHPGLRVPGAWDAFELAVRAILGQQVSVTAARTLAGRPAGRRLRHPVGRLARGRAESAVPAAGGPGGGGPDDDRPARGTGSRHFRPGPRGARRPDASAALRHPGRHGRKAVRRAGHRPVDGALHRDARVEPAGCLPRGGPRPAARRRRPRRAADAGPPDRDRGAVAALARLCRPAPMDGRRGAQAEGDNRMTLSIDRIDSPIGSLNLVADGRGLRALDYADQEARMMRLLRARGDARIAEADDPQGFSSRLRAYLAGELDALDEIPVAAEGTPFQQAVWAALRGIAAGTTLTYNALARRLGKPAASRAVGLANARNPVAIVVPCHRVIGTDGSLTGYAGGLERKRWLLAHEGVQLPGGARLPGFAGL